VIDRCSQLEHFFGVRTLIEIEQAIEKLPSSELRQLHRWIAERDADDWDAEIARDAAAGKFDALRQRVIRDNDNGLCENL
jgi:hypothetical protein